MSIFDLKTVTNTLHTIGRDDIIKILDTTQSYVHIARILKYKKRQSLHDALDVYRTFTFAYNH